MRRRSVTIAFLLALLFSFLVYSQEYVQEQEQEIPPVVNLGEYDVYSEPPFDDVQSADTFVSHTFSFGVVTHWAMDHQLDWMVEMGVTWVRTGVGWEHVEPEFHEPPRYQWDVADKLVGDCKSRGLKILWGLPYTPSWASSNGKLNGFPKDAIAREHWRKFVRATVERYRNDIDYYEPWNEPNHGKFWAGTTDQYIDYILIPAWEEIKAVDPNKKVVGPTLATLRGAAIKVQNFFKVLGRRDAARYFDIVSQNVYESLPEDVINQFEKGDYECWWILCKKKRDSLFKIYRVNGFANHPVWVNEFGWCSNKVGETRQGSRVVDTLERFGRRPRFQMAFIYCLKDDPRFPKVKWGVFKADETPKPLYWKLRDYTQLLALGQGSASGLLDDDRLDWNGERIIVNDDPPALPRLYLVPKKQDD